MVSSHSLRYAILRLKILELDMRALTRTLLVVAFGIACRATLSVAATYSDPSGFSFAHPDSWVVVTQDNQEELPEQARAWIARNNLDFRQISVAVLDTEPREFQPNVNVVVTDKQALLNDRFVKELSELLPGQYKTMGVTIERLKVDLAQIGSREVVTTEQLARLPGIPFSLLQRQVYFVGGGKTYIVTCSTSAKDVDTTKPQFDALLNSFTVPAPVASGPLGGLKLDHIFKMGLAGGIIGGVIAGIVAGLRVAGKRKRTNGGDFQ